MIRVVSKAPVGILDCGRGPAEVGNALGLSIYGIGTIAFGAVTVVVLIVLELPDPIVCGTIVVILDYQVPWAKSTCLLAPIENRRKPWVIWQAEVVSPLADCMMRI